MLLVSVLFAAFEIKEWVCQVILKTYEDCRTASCCQFQDFPEVLSQICLISLTSRKVDLRQNNKISRNFGVSTPSYNGQQTVVIFITISKQALLAVCFPN